MTALSIVARNASWPRAHTGKAICVFHSSSCPISLYLATIESEKVSFHQINSKSGKRIRYRKVDEGTGEEVPAEQIVKAYEVGKRPYIEITDEELEAIALESRRAIENDELYSIRPYYIAPDGKVGQDAFVVVRRVLEEMKMVAIALFGSG